MDDVLAWVDVFVRIECCLVVGFCQLELDLFSNRTCFNDFEANAGVQETTSEVLRGPKCPG